MFLKTLKINKPLYHTNISYYFASNQLSEFSDCIFLPLKPAVTIIELRIFESLFKLTRYPARVSGNNKHFIQRHIRWICQILNRSLKIAFTTRANDRSPSDKPWRHRQHYLETILDGEFEIERKKWKFLDVRTTAKYIVQFSVVDLRNVQNWWKTFV